MFKNYIERGVPKSLITFFVVKSVRIWLLFSTLARLFTKKCRSETALEAKTVLVDHASKKFQKLYADEGVI